MSVKSVTVNAADISSLGSGCVIQNALYPKDITELMTVQRAFGRDNRFYIAGGLTNTLVAEIGERDVVIFSDLFKGIRVREDRITVRSGEKTAHVADVARICGLSGMEDLCCIPGTVGGGLSGNAGCFDTSFSDVVESVKLFHLDDGQPEKLSAEEIAFRYRYCNLRKNVDFITEITFRLYPDDGMKIASRMMDVRNKRKNSLPPQRSLGSVFKRIDDVSCGYYLDKVGMKGFRVGGMQVSEKHANVIVNSGGGTPEDYLAVLAECEKKIQKNIGKKPEREVIIFGGDR